MGKVHGNALSQCLNPQRTRPFADAVPRNSRSHEREFAKAEGEKISGLEAFPHCGWYPVKYLTRGLPRMRTHSSPKEANAILKETHLDTFYFTRFGSICQRGPRNFLAHGTTAPPPSPNVGTQKNQPLRLVPQRAGGKMGMMGSAGVLCPTPWS